MINVFPRPRDIASMLLYSALGSILLVVGFTLFPDQADSMAFMFPGVLCTAALMFRLDAHSSRDLVTRKRLFVAGLASLWGMFIAMAGQSIVGGHYFNASALLCGSMVWILSARCLMRSAPEQWFGNNWKEAVKA